MENLYLSRRRLLQGSSAALALATLTACGAGGQPAATQAPGTEATTAGGDAPTSAPAGEVVTLNYWVCWPGEYAEHERKAILDLYEQKTGGAVKIEHLAVPSDVAQKLLTAVAAGEPPDVATCFGALIPLAAKGAFIPIDEYVAASTYIDLDDLYPAPLAATRWQGKQYGFPYNCSCEMILVNRGLLEDAGIEVAGSDNPDEWGPTNWDEFTELSKQLVKFDDAGNLEVAAYLNWYVRHNSMWFCANGATPYDPESNTLSLTNDQCAEGWQMVADYAWEIYGDVSKADAFLEGQGTDAASPFCTGQQTMMYACYSQPPRIVGWCPDVQPWPWKVPMGPMGTHKITMGGGDYTGILTGSKHPDESYQFIEWMVKEGNALWKYDPPCCMSQAGAVKPEWEEVFGAEWGQKIATWWEQGLKDACVVENFPSYSYMNDELQRVFELVLHKLVTVEAGLAEVQANVEADMANYA